MDITALRERHRGQQGLIFQHAEPKAPEAVVTISSASARVDYSDAR
ncbi:hypothetical protein [Rhodanobacter terrae]|uniref:Uncharacterized protein n=1 Tax=Rhodanobacter terrae TaxID=418647 RepID=A0ABW0SZ55_9GAMM